jgi:hypothetical protein
MMQDYEKLGSFYLGREFDLDNKILKENLLLYDSKDLVTHAVCVGMTGSGKTGLCIGLLEEAAIDGIPSIVVDPKGDLCNLLLAFDNLSPEEFKPWINEDDARKKDLTSQEYAADQAGLWEKGLAEWGQDRERIKRLKDSAEFVIYTPGSSAGIPVSILKSFSAPGKVIIDDSDVFRERINTTVTSLLNLMDIDADPLQSREHILLSTILDVSWRSGQDMDLAGLIEAILEPPVTRIGVFDLESFFPDKERTALAMKMNTLLAAPGFQTWLDGEPLDMEEMMYSKSGKPRVCIFAISHLNDTERMFFVSLLLTQMLGWMRTQSGTSSLRSLFYMDEIFGYLPPVANPPSKAPMLTLLKQARAFGVGIVLATQNPVDLDYKALSNTGTWFIGRLQTDRDKERVLDGLEGVGSSAGGRFDRKRMGQILAGLGKRVFLMNNVHEDEPVIFQTRWVLSYLRGPMTRGQIKLLMAQDTSVVLPPPIEEQDVEESVKLMEPVAELLDFKKPVMSSNFPQYFIPIRKQVEVGEFILYKPMLMGIGKYYIASAKHGVALEKDFAILTEFSESPTGINWSEGLELDSEYLDLEEEPEVFECSYGTILPEASKKKSYISWKTDFKNWLYRSKTIELLQSPCLKLVSKPGETERDFRIRLQHSAHEKRDSLLHKLKKKYTPKLNMLEDRIKQAQIKVEEEKDEASLVKKSYQVSLGSAVFSTLFGRKKRNRRTISKMTKKRRAARIEKEEQDVDRAKDKLKVLRKRFAELEKTLEKEMDNIKADVDPKTEIFNSISIKPKKTDIDVSFMALTWVPCMRDDESGLIPVWDNQLIL